MDFHPISSAVVRAGLFFLVFTCCTIFSGAVIAASAATFPAAKIIRTLINSPVDRLDYARAKLTIDKLIDPSIDVENTLIEMNQMVSTVEEMFATIPAKEAEKSIERMRALQAFIYRAGHWNDDKPFQYNLDDPYGQRISTKLLPNYMKSRKGNCISMPILFLVLGEKLRLDLSLSTAPLHVFIKYTDDQTGKTYNLETTSGAGFTRDSWYHKKSPMMDAAIRNGVYLKNLSRKETLAVIAGLFVEHLIDTKKYEQAIAVSDVILEAYPAYGYLLAKKGTAYFHLLKSEIIDQYPDPKNIPASKQKFANELYRQNQTAFAQAEALGWRQTQLK